MVSTFDLVIDYRGIDEKSLLYILVPFTLKI